MTSNNPWWQHAVLVTEEEAPDPRRYKSVLGRNLKHFSLLCGKAAGENKKYHADDVLEAWRWLRAPKPDGMGFSDATVAALLNGNPTWIERWMQSVWDSQPPIWDESKRQKWDEQYQGFLERRSQQHE